MSQIFNLQCKLFAWVAFTNDTVLVNFIWVYISLNSVFTEWQLKSNSLWCPEFEHHGQYAHCFLMTGRIWLNRYTFPLFGKSLGSENKIALYDKKLMLIQSCNQKYTPQPKKQQESSLKTFVTKTPSCLSESWQEEIKPSSNVSIFLFSSHLHMLLSFKLQQQTIVCNRVLLPVHQ